MKIPSISLRNCSCYCQLPRGCIVKELRWVKFKRVGPGCHGGEKAVLALSGKCLLPIPGGLTLEAGRGRQRRWTVPKLSVLITLQKLLGRQDRRPCLLSVVMMLGIVCKVWGR